MSSQYNLLNIFIANLIAWPNLTSEQKKLTPPKIIAGKYFFVKLFPKIGPKKSYLLAIYKDKNGRIYFVKMRSNKKRGYHYYSLLNEANVYKAILDTSKRIRYEKSGRNSKFRVPELIGLFEDEQMVALILEFVSGKPISSLPDKTKFDYFLEASNYINSIGKLMTSKERKILSQRSFVNLVFLSPFLLSKTIFNFPMHILDIIIGYVFFILHTPLLNKNWKFELVHRDLHFENILISRNGLIVLDLQQCLFTHPFQEFVTILRYYWQDGEFYKYLLQHLGTQQLKKNEDRLFFRALLANSAIHGLTDKSFSKRVIDSWFDLLKRCSYSSFDLLFSKYE